MMHAWYYGCMYNVCITSKCHKNIQLFGEKPQSSSLTHNTTECRQHSVVMATELVQPSQPRDLACGTLFQSSCVIPTSSSDCSEDSWRDTFFPDAWTRHSVISDMRRHRKKTLTYLLTLKNLRTELDVYRVRMEWFDLCRRRCLIGRGIVQDGTVEAGASHQGPCEHCVGSPSPASATDLICVTYRPQHHDRYYRCFIYLAWAGTDSEVTGNTSTTTPENDRNISFCFSSCALIWTILNYNQGACRRTLARKLIS